MKSKEKAPRGTKCSLCGEKKPFISLIRTKCCNNWICNDLQRYRPFSFSLDSCSRNHERYTSCAFHHNEEHPGKWQDCAECKSLGCDEPMFHCDPQLSAPKKSTPKVKPKPKPKSSSNKTNTKIPGNLSSWILDASKSANKGGKSADKPTTSGTQRIGQASTSKANILKANKTSKSPAKSEAIIVLDVSDSETTPKTRSKTRIQNLQSLKD